MVVSGGKIEYTFTNFNAAIVREGRLAHPIMLPERGIILVEV